MRLSLRAGEKIYLNGAVVAVDRKVSLHILNDATFLLETHVMQEKEASTPLRQLYFLVQIALMDPASAKLMQPAVERMIYALEPLLAVEPALSDGLQRAASAFSNGRSFETLKILRSLFSGEQALIAGGLDFERRISA